MSMVEAMTRLAEASEAQVRQVAREERRRRDAEIAEREKARWERGYQSEPKRLDFRMMAPAVPELALIFQRVVPPEFWSQDGRAVVVACPCGHEPVVDEAIPQGCECERTYVYTGDAVRVAGTPGGLAAVS